MHVWPTNQSLVTSLDCVWSAWGSSKEGPSRPFCPCPSACPWIERRCQSQWIGRGCTVQKESCSCSAANKTISLSADLFRVRDSGLSNPLQSSAVWLLVQSQFTHSSNHPSIHPSNSVHALLCGSVIEASPYRTSSFVTITSFFAVFTFVVGFLAIFLPSKSERVKKLQSTNWTAGRTCKIDAHKRNNKASPLVQYKHTKPLCYIPVSMSWHLSAT